MRSLVAQWIICAATLFATLSLSAVAQADDARLKTEVTALLNDGWPLGPDGLAAAVGHFQSARAAAPSDVRPVFAMAVTQIRQRRYPDANLTLDDVLKLKPSHLSAWQAKVWLSMVARKYDAALADVEHMLKSWPQGTSADEVESRAETARFLGRVLGFLWGPATGKVAEDRLTEIEKLVETALVADDRQTFAESRGSVLGKFTDLQDKTETTREKAKVDEEKQKEQDRERLASEKQGVNAEKGTLDQQATSARAAAQAQIQQLAAALQLLDAQFNQLAAQGAALQAEIAGLLGQEQLLIQQANATDDEFDSRRLLSRARGIMTLRIPLEARYAALDAQARGINAQRQINLGQQAQVSTQYQAEMKRLGMKADSLERTEKRIAGDLKKANTAATGVTAGVRNLSTTSTAFVTYFDYPVEREKRRLIDSFK